MELYEVKLTFVGHYMSRAENETDAIADVMERCRAEYGNEVADYGHFEIVPDNGNKTE